MAAGFGQRVETLSECAASGRRRQQEPPTHGAVDRIKRCPWYTPGRNPRASGLCGNVKGVCMGFCHRQRQQVQREFGAGHDSQDLNEGEKEQEVTGSLVAFC